MKLQCRGIYTSCLFYFNTCIYHVPIKFWDGYIFIYAICPSKHLKGEEFLVLLVFAVFSMLIVTAKSMFHTFCRQVIITHVYYKNTNSYNHLYIVNLLLKLVLNCSKWTFCFSKEQSGHSKIKLCGGWKLCAIHIFLLSQCQIFDEMATLHSSNMEQNNLSDPRGTRAQNAKFCGKFSFVLFLKKINNSYTRWLSRSLFHSLSIKCSAQ